MLAACDLAFAGFLTFESKVGVGWLEMGIQKILALEPQHSGLQSHRDEPTSVKAAFSSPMSTELKLCPEAEDLQG